MKGWSSDGPGQGQVGNEGRQERDQESGVGIVHGVRRAEGEHTIGLKSFGFGGPNGGYSRHDSIMCNWSPFQVPGTFTKNSRIISLSGRLPMMSQTALSEVPGTSES